MSAKCKLSKYLVVLFLTLVLFMSAATEGLAFTYNGYRWFYPYAYVRYTSDVPSSWVSSGALYQGRRVWSDAGSKFRFYYSSDASSYVTAGYYGETGWLAVTYIYRWAPWYISKCITKFNRSYPWSIDGSPGYYDVQSVAAHEFGHWLSLGHSSYYYATMYKSIGTGETWKRTLHWDDIAGIKYIYGE